MSSINNPPATPLNRPNQFQKSFFPFDAFEADDPNTTATPVLRMKPPWSFATGGTPAGGVPIGGIIMWSGTVASIPADWQLCDGTNGTPDLRDKFIVGAKQDSGGVAKTNLTGALAQTGGTTAHIHSAHANLTHTGLTIGDHTGLTHGLSIANHPDLTHVAISSHSQASQIVTVQGNTIADHSVASQIVTVAGLTHADHSVANVTASTPSVVGTATSVVGSGASVVGTATTASLGVGSTLALSLSSQGTARTIVTASAAVQVASHTVNVPSATVNVPSHTVNVPSMVATVAAFTLTHASHPTHTGAWPAITLTHASIPTGTGAFPANTLTHNALNTHVGTDYGVHTFTAPAAHGTAGTVTHSYNQPNDHVISAHDTVANVIPFYALAFIQRVA